jgi:hypothetical protein
VARSGFRLDPGFADALARTAEVGALVKEKASTAAARAKEIVAVDTGRLRDSIAGEAALTPRGWQGRVVATDFKAPWEEEGTVRRSARPFLRPAVEQTVGPIEAPLEGEG